MKTDQDTGAQQAFSGRRAFLGLAAAGAGGVMLAPGIQLMEVAQAAAKFLLERYRR